MCSLFGGFPKTSKKMFLIPKKVCYWEVSFIYNILFLLSYNIYVNTDVGNSTWYAYGS